MNTSNQQIPVYMKGENIIYDHLMYSGINYIITGSPYILYAIVALYLFVLPIWLYSKNGVFGNVWTRENGFKSHLPKGLKKKVFAVSACMFIVVVVVYGTWYNCITEEGITQRLFFGQKAIHGKTLIIILYLQILMVHCNIRL